MCMRLVLSVTRIQKKDERDENIESPRKNPPNSTAIQSRVEDKASNNLGKHTYKSVYTSIC